MSCGWRRLAQLGLICLFPLVGGLLPAFPDSPTRIAVVLSRDIAPYRQALGGFEDVLQETGRPYKLYEFTMEGVAADRGNLVGKVVGRHPDLILTIGSTATRRISEGVNDIPIVFSMVLPSNGNTSLQGLRASNPNLTGTSMEIPIRTQFQKLMEVLPEARRIGVLYDPEVTGPMVEDAVLTAEALGLELLPIPVGSQSDILESTDRLIEGADVLWSVADSTVFSPHGLKHILLSTLRNRIPFVGLSPSFVKAGALLALSTDYRDLGRQSAEQGIRILDGEHPSNVPITVPRNISLSINMNTAKQIQVRIGEEIQQSAELFF